MYATYQNFTIRDWTTRDRETAAAIIRWVLNEYNLPWQPDTSDRDSIEVEKHYFNRGGEFWIVLQEKKIVGTAGYYPISRGEKAVEIRKMYLLPEVRGKGLGRFLLEQLERAIAARGFGEIWVETASVLAEAVQLYENSGYRPATGVETPRCDRVYHKIIASQQGGNSK
ncbi:GNAT family N-acetyltransferase [Oscillatoria sp. FACHB-1406]|uniref:GNAT family N-acetyltransferase n=1 Tax=Oscillatoria sp. FACHB-1406 TaxID=2692846 RepID=UPI0016871FAE|nr:GNAT family N-acetyltransferase [Oscillatoria sp. FACHB-1406]MBD2579587.1 GNAT family N-acetyltransferase [Oscillatoria sp. FACHB-1406]